GGSGGSAGVVTQLTSIYAPTGTYTSGVLDLGGQVDVTGLAWTETKPGSTNITMEARSGNVAIPDGSWTGWASVANGGDPAGAVQYIQYRATLSTAAVTATPTLDSVTIDYQTSANYNFSLSPLPSSSEIVAGAASAVISTITVAVQNPQDPSITDPVNFSAIVSPSGPTISFRDTATGLPATSCLPSSGTCTVDIYASSAALGNFSIEVRGSNASMTYPDGLTKTVYVPLTVQPQMIYAPSLTAYQGDVIKESATSAYPAPTVQTLLTITRSGGADEGIASIASNAPAGIIMVASPANSAPFGSTFMSTLTFSAASTVASADYPITITITPIISGAGNAQTVLFTLRVRNPLTYSLSASPDNGAVLQGNSTTSTINGAYGGYPAGTENVVFTNFTSTTNPSAFSSVPLVGVISVSFIPSVCTLSQSQTTCAKTMSVSASSNATPGTYQITIPGSSSITSSAPIPSALYTLIVTGPFDFIMTMGAPIAPCTLPTGCEVEQGTSIQVAVNVSSISAGGEDVAFSLQGLPADVSSQVVYNPDPCRPSLTSTCVITFIISPESTAETKTYAVNLVGASSKKMHSLPFALTITPGFTFEISLSEPSGVSMRGGGASARVTVFITGSGIPKAVALSVAGLAGTGVVPEYQGGQQSCVPKCEPQIVFNAASALNCPPDGKCIYNIMITGMYGTQVVQKPYTLTVVNPFNFDLALSSTQGSIMQGGNNAPCAGDESPSSTPGKCDKKTVLEVTWLAGGSGTEVVSLSASVIPNPTPILPADIVSFNPDSITGLEQASECAESAKSSTLCSIITLTAPIGLVSDSYTILIVATSGTVVKTKTYALTVGTTLNFELSTDPKSERVEQGFSSALVTITAQNMLAQQVSSTISFTIGDAKYKLPKDVTVNPSILASCTLEAPLDATCDSSIRFDVGPDAINGTYLIPIIGKSGPIKQLVYYTLKVGPLDLVSFVSPEFKTDPHQRPQGSFTWSPPAIFVGDTVSLDATPSTVYVAGQPGTAAATPANGTNAEFSWNIPNTTETPQAAPNPTITFGKSGPFVASLTITDNETLQCYNALSVPEDCWCSVVAAEMIGGADIEVSKPRPSFREVTPQ
ncbi:MAG: hypothetical protein NUV61_00875, partial [Candidatus Azambacteria bacterium]|nr:hypothetical protein [Candidatus Azambacteria bacterium]